MTVTCAPEGTRFCEVQRATSSAALCCAHMPRGIMGTVTSGGIITAGGSLWGFLVHEGYDS